MFEIKCSKAQYERIIKAGCTFFENGKCFLGKTFRFCPNLDDPTITSCSECLRENIKRINENKRKKQTFQKPVVQQLAGRDSEFPVEMSCPNCFQPIIIIEAWKKLNYKPRFCYECGQALDWGEKE